MRGYKGFNSDLTCRGFQYEIGKTYEMDGVIALCSRGFHFCEELRQTFEFYDKNTDRFCEVESGEFVVRGSDKCCTDKITIIRELSRVEINRVIYGYGYGYGDGDGYGYGYGYGDGKNIQKILIFKELSA